MKILAHKIPIVSIIVFLLLSCSKDEAVVTVVVTPTEPEVVTNNKPFPNHTNYIGDHIKPNNYGQTELDNHTKTFYDGWKALYLKNDCNTNEYYIKYRNDAKTVSEAHGYGMMIMCFMAGHDSNAKSDFDKLFNYYKSHPSNINSNLMDWQQITCNDAASSSDDSATDGDIDIAFSLLLAHNQWGSEGNINYLQQAQRYL